VYGGGLWYNKCGIFAVTIMPDAAWYNLRDSTWQAIHEDYSQDGEIAVNQLTHRY